MRTLVLALALVLAAFGPDTCAARNGAKGGTARCAFLDELSVQGWNMTLEDGTVKCLYGHGAVQSLVISNKEELILSDYEIDENYEQEVLNCQKANAKGQVNLYACRCISQEEAIFSWEDYANVMLIIGACTFPVGLLLTCFICSIYQRISECLQRSHQAKHGRELTGCSWCW